MRDDGFGVPQCMTRRGESDEGSLDDITFVRCWSDWADSDTGLDYLRKHYPAILLASFTEHMAKAG